MADDEKVPDEDKLTEDELKDVAGGLAGPGQQMPGEAIIGEAG